MACIDGVMIGNTVTSILGTDMSHDWKDPDFGRDPVLSEVKKYLRKMEEHNKH